MPAGMSPAAASMGDGEKDLADRMVDFIQEYWNIDLSQSWGIADLQQFLRSPTVQDLTAEQKALVFDVVAGMVEKMPAKVFLQNVPVFRNALQPILESPAFRDLTLEDQKNILEICTDVLHHSAFRREGVFPNAYLNLSGLLKSRDFLELPMEAQREILKILSVIPVRFKNGAFFLFEAIHRMLATKAFKSVKGDSGKEIELVRFLKNVLPCIYEYEAGSIIIAIHILEHLLNSKVLTPENQPQVLGTYLRIFKGIRVHTVLRNPSVLGPLNNLLESKDLMGLSVSVQLKILKLLPAIPRLFKTRTPAILDMIDKALRTKAFLSVRGDSVKEMGIVRFLSSLFAYLSEYNANEIDKAGNTLSHFLNSKALTLENQPRLFDAYKRVVESINAHVKSRIPAAYQAMDSYIITMMTPENAVEFLDLITLAFEKAEEYTGVLGNIEYSYKLAQRWLGDFSAEESKNWIDLFRNILEKGGDKESLVNIFGDIWQIHQWVSEKEEARHEFYKRSILPEIRNIVGQREGQDMREAFQKIYGELKSQEGRDMDYVLATTGASMGSETVILRSGATKDLASRFFSRLWRDQNDMSKTGDSSQNDWRMPSIVADNRSAGIASPFGLAMASPNSTVDYGLRPPTKSVDGPAGALVAGTVDFSTLSAERSTLSFGASMGKTPNYITPTEREKRLGTPEKVRAVFREMFPDATAGEYTGLEKLLAAIKSSVHDHSRTFYKKKQLAKAYTALVSLLGSGLITRQNRKKIFELLTGIPQHAGGRTDYVFRALKQFLRHYPQPWENETEIYETLKAIGRYGAYEPFVALSTLQVLLHAPFINRQNRAQILTSYRILVEHFGNRKNAYYELKDFFQSGVVTEKNQKEIFPLLIAIAAHGSFQSRKDAYTALQQILESKALTPPSQARPARGGRRDEKPRGYTGKNRRMIFDLIAFMPRYTKNWTGEALQSLKKLMESPAFAQRDLRQMIPILRSIVKAEEYQSHEAFDGFLAFLESGDLTPENEAFVIPAIPRMVRAAGAETIPAVQALSALIRAPLKTENLKDALNLYIKLILETASHAEKEGPREWSLSALKGIFETGQVGDDTFQDVFSLLSAVPPFARSRTHQIFGELTNLLASDFYGRLTLENQKKFLSVLTKLAGVPLAKPSAEDEVHLFFGSLDPDSSPVLYELRWSANDTFNLLVSIASQAPLRCGKVLEEVESLLDSKIIARMDFKIITSFLIRIINLLGNRAAAFLDEERLMILLNFGQTGWWLEDILGFVEAFSKTVKSNWDVHLEELDEFFGSAVSKRSPLQKKAEMMRLVTNLTWKSGNGKNVGRVYKALTAIFSEAEENKKKRPVLDREIFPRLVEMAGQEEGKRLAAEVEKLRDAFINEKPEGDSDYAFVLLSANPFIGLGNSLTVQAASLGHVESQNAKVKSKNYKSKVKLNSSPRSTADYGLRTVDFSTLSAERYPLTSGASLGAADDLRQALRTRFPDVTKQERQDLNTVIRLVQKNEKGADFHLKELLPILNSAGLSREVLKEFLNLLARSYEHSPGSDWLSFDDYKKLLENKNFQKLSAQRKNQLFGILLKGILNEDPGDSHSVVTWVSHLFQQKVFEPIELETLNSLWNVLEAIAQHTRGRVFLAYRGLGDFFDKAKAGDVEKIIEMIQDVPAQAGEGTYRVFERMDAVLRGMNFPEDRVQEVRDFLRGFVSKAGKKVDDAAANLQDFLRLAFLGGLELEDRSRILKFCEKVNDQSKNLLREIYHELASVGYWINENERVRKPIFWKWIFPYLEGLVESKEAPEILKEIIQLHRQFLLPMSALIEFHRRTVGSSIYKKLSREQRREILGRFLHLLRIVMLSQDAIPKWENGLYNEVLNSKKSLRGRLSRFEAIFGQPEAEDLGHLRKGWRQVFDEEILQGFTAEEGYALIDTLFSLMEKSDQPTIPHDLLNYFPRFHRWVKEDIRNRLDLYRSSILERLMQITGQMEGESMMKEVEKLLNGTMNAGDDELAYSVQRAAYSTGSPGTASLESKKLKGKRQKAEGEKAIETSKSGLLRPASGGTRNDETGEAIPFGNGEKKPDEANSKWQIANSLGRMGNRKAEVKSQNDKSKLKTPSWDWMILGTSHFMPSSLRGVSPLAGRRGSPQIIGESVRTSPPIIVADNLSTEIASPFGLAMTAPRSTVDYGLRTVNFSTLSAERSTLSSEAKALKAERSDVGMSPTAGASLGAEDEERQIRESFARLFPQAGDDEKAIFERILVAVKKDAGTYAPLEKVLKFSAAHFRQLPVSFWGKGIFSNVADFLLMSLYRTYLAYARMIYSLRKLLFFVGFYSVIPPPSAQEMDWPWLLNLRSRFTRPENPHDVLDLLEKITRFTPPDTLQSYDRLLEILQEIRGEKLNHELFSWLSFTIERTGQYAPGILWALKPLLISPLVARHQAQSFSLLKTLTDRFPDKALMYSLKLKKILTPHLVLPDDEAFILGLLAVLMDYAPDQFNDALDALQTLLELWRGENSPHRKKPFSLFGALVQSAILAHGRGDDTGDASLADLFEALSEASLQPLLFLLISVGRYSGGYGSRFVYHFDEFKGFPQGIYPRVAWILEQPYDSAMERLTHLGTLFHPAPVQQLSEEEKEAFGDLVLTIDEKAEDWDQVLRVYQALGEVIHWVEIGLEKRMPLFRREILQRLVDIFAQTEGAERVRMIREYVIDLTTWDEPADPDEYSSIASSLGRKWLEPLKNIWNLRRASKDAQAFFNLMDSEDVLSLAPDVRQEVLFVAQWIPHIMTQSTWVVRDLGLYLEKFKALLASQAFKSLSPTIQKAVLQAVRTHALDYPVVMDGEIFEISYGVFSFNRWKVFIEAISFGPALTKEEREYLIERTAALSPELGGDVLNDRNFWQPIVESEIFKGMNSSERKLLLDLIVELAAHAREFGARRFVLLRDGLLEWWLNHIYPSDRQASLELLLQMVLKSGEPAINVDRLFEVLDNLSRIVGQKGEEGEQQFERLVLPRMREWAGQFEGERLLENLSQLARAFADEEDDESDYNLLPTSLAISDKMGVEGKSLGRGNEREITQEEITRQLLINQELMTLVKADYFGSLQGQAWEVMKEVVGAIIDEEGSDAAHALRNLRELLVPNALKSPDFLGLSPENQLQALAPLIHIPEELRGYRYVMIQALGGFIEILALKSWPAEDQSAWIEMFWTLTFKIGNPDALTQMYRSLNNIYRWIARKPAQIRRLGRGKAEKLAGKPATRISVYREEIWPLLKQWAGQLEGEDLFRKIMQLDAGKEESQRQGDYALGRDVPESVNGRVGETAKDVSLRGVPPRRDDAAISNSNSNLLSSLLSTWIASPPARNDETAASLGKIREIAEKISDRIVTGLENSKVGKVFEKRSRSELRKTFGRTFQDGGEEQEEKFRKILEFVDTTVPLWRSNVTQRLTEILRRIRFLSLKNRDAILSILITLAERDSQFTGEPTVGRHAYGAYDALKEFLGTSGLKRENQDAVVELLQVITEVTGENTYRAFYQLKDLLESRSLFYISYPSLFLYPKDFARRFIWTVSLVSWGASKALFYLYWLRHTTRIDAKRGEAVFSMLKTVTQNSGDESGRAFLYMRKFLETAFLADAEWLSKHIEQIDSLVMAVSEAAKEETFTALGELEGAIVSRTFRLLTPEEKNLLLTLIEQMMLKGQDWKVTAYAIQEIMKWVDEDIKGRISYFKKDILGRLIEITSQMEGAALDQEALKLALSLFGTENVPDDYGAFVAASLGADDDEAIRQRNGRLAYEALEKILESRGYRSAPPSEQGALLEQFQDLILGLSQKSSLDQKELGLSGVLYLNLSTVLKANHEWTTEDLKKILHIFSEIPDELVWTLDILLNGHGIFPRAYISLQTPDAPAILEDVFQSLLNIKIYSGRSFQDFSQVMNGILTLRRFGDLYDAVPENRKSLWFQHFIGSLERITRLVGENGHLVLRQWRWLLDTWVFYWLSPEEKLGWWSVLEDLMYQVEDGETLMALMNEVKEIHKLFGKDVGNYLSERTKKGMDFLRREVLPKFLSIAGQPSQDVGVLGELRLYHAELEKVLGDEKNSLFPEYGLLETASSLGEQKGTGNTSLPVPFWGRAEAKSFKDERNAAGKGPAAASLGKGPSKQDKHATADTVRRTFGSIFPQAADDEKALFENIISPGKSNQVVQFQYLKGPLTLYAWDELEQAIRMAALHLTVPKGGLGWRVLSWMLRLFYRFIPWEGWLRWLVTSGDSGYLKDFFSLLNKISQQAHGDMASSLFTLGLALKAPRVGFRSVEEFLNFLHAVADHSERRLNYAFYAVSLLQHSSLLDPKYRDEINRLLKTISERAGDNAPYAYLTLQYVLHPRFVPRKYQKEYLSLLIKIAERAGTLTGSAYKALGEILDSKYTAPAGFKEFFELADLITQYAETLPHLGFEELKPLFEFLTARNGSAFFGILILLAKREGSFRHRAFHEFLRLLRTRAIGAWNQEELFSLLGFVLENADLPLDSFFDDLRRPLLFRAAAEIFTREESYQWIHSMRLLTEKAGSASSMKRIYNAVYQMQLWVDEKMEERLPIYRRQVLPELIRFPGQFEGDDLVQAVEQLLGDLKREKSGTGTDYDFTRAASLGTREEVRTIRYYFRLRIPKPSAEEEKYLENAIRRLRKLDVSGHAFALRALAALVRSGALTEKNLKRILNQYIQLAQLIIKYGWVKRSDWTRQNLSDRFGEVQKVFSLEALNAGNVDLFFEVLLTMAKQTEGDMDRPFRGLAKNLSDWPSPLISGSGRRYKRKYLGIKEFLSVILTLSKHDDPVDAMTYGRYISIVSSGALSPENYREIFEQVDETVKIADKESRIALNGLAYFLHGKPDIRPQDFVSLAKAFNAWIRRFDSYSQSERTMIFSEIVNLLIFGGESFEYLGYEDRMHWLELFTGLAERSGRPKIFNDILKHISEIFHWVNDEEKFKERLSFLNTRVLPELVHLPGQLEGKDLVRAVEKLQKALTDTESSASEDYSLARAASLGKNVPDRKDTSLRGVPPLAGRRGNLGTGIASPPARNDETAASMGSETVILRSPAKGGTTKDLASRFFSRPWRDQNDISSSAASLGKGADTIRETFQRLYPQAADATKKVLEQVISAVGPYPQIERPKGGNAFLLGRRHFNLWPVHFWNGPHTLNVYEELQNLLRLSAIYLGVPKGGIIGRAIHFILRSLYRFMPREGLLKLIIRLAPPVSLNDFLVLLEKIPGQAQRKTAVALHTIGLVLETPDIMDGFKVTEQQFFDFLEIVAEFSSHGLDDGYYPLSVLFKRGLFHPDYEKEIRGLLKTIAEYAGDTAAYAYATLISVLDPKLVPDVPYGQYLALLTDIAGYAGLHTGNAFNALRHLLEFAKQIPSADYDGMQLLAHWMSAYAQSKSKATWNLEESERVIYIETLRKLFEFLTARAPRAFLGLLVLMGDASPMENAFFDVVFPLRYPSVNEANIEDLYATIAFLLERPDFYQEEFWIYFHLARPIVFESAPFTTEESRQWMHMIRLMTEKAGDIESVDRAYNALNKIQHNWVDKKGDERFPIYLRQVLPELGLMPGQLEGHALVEAVEKLQKELMDQESGAGADYDFTRAASLGVGDRTVILRSPAKGGTTKDLASRFFSRPWRDQNDISSSAASLGIAERKPSAELLRLAKEARKTYTWRFPSAGKDELEIIDHLIAAIQNTPAIGSEEGFGRLRVKSLKALRPLLASPSLTDRNHREVLEILRLLGEAAPLGTMDYSLKSVQDFLEVFDKTYLVIGRFRIPEPAFVRKRPLLDWIWRELLGIQFKKTSFSAAERDEMLPIAAKLLSIPPFTVVGYKTLFDYLERMVTLPYSTPDFSKAFMAVLKTISESIEEDVIEVMIKFNEMLWFFHGWIDKDTGALLSLLKVLIAEAGPKSVEAMDKMRAMLDHMFSKQVPGQLRWFDLVESITLHSGSPENLVAIYESLAKLHRKVLAQTSSQPIRFEEDYLQWLSEIAGQLEGEDITLRLNGILAALEKGEFWTEDYRSIAAASAASMGQKLVPRSTSSGDGFGIASSASGLLAMTSLRGRVATEAISKQKGTGNTPLPVPFWNMFEGIDREKILRDLLDEKIGTPDERIRYAVGKWVVPQAKSRLKVFEQELDGSLKGVIDHLNGLESVENFIFSEDFEKFIQTQFQSIVILSEAKDLRFFGLRPQNDLSNVDEKALMDSIRQATTKIMMGSANKGIEVLMKGLDMKKVEEYQQRIDQTWSSFAAAKDKNGMVLAVNYPETHSELETVLKVLARYSGLISRLELIHRRDQKVVRKDWAFVRQLSTQILNPQEPRQAFLEVEKRRFNQEVFYNLTQNLLPETFQQRFVSMLAEIGEIPDPNLQVLAYSASLVLLLKLSRLNNRERAELLKAETLRRWIEEDPSLSFLKNTFEFKDGVLRLKLDEFISNFASSRITEAAA